MKTVFQPVYFSPPARFVDDGFWDGICRVDPDPADGDGGGNPPPAGGDDTAAELERLRNTVTNLRSFERRFKALEAIVGDTNPEKLQELRDAQTRAEQQQAEHEQRILAARNEVVAEYKPQIEQFSQRAQKAEEQAQKVQTQFELFQSFNRNEGIGKKFDSFVGLSGRYFVRDNDQQLRVKDEAGQDVIYRDPDSGDRVATPDDFMKMLIKGEDLSKYKFADIETLQWMFEPYNKAMGAGLPSKNGQPSGKALQEMSNAELANYAFKS